MCVKQINVFVRNNRTFATIYKEPKTRRLWHKGCFFFCVLYIYVNAANQQSWQVNLARLFCFRAGGAVWRAQGGFVVSEMTALEEINSVRLPRHKWISSHHCMKDCFFFKAKLISMLPLGCLCWPSAAKIQTYCWENALTALYLYMCVCVAAIFSFRGFSWGLFFKPPMSPREVCTCVCVLVLGEDHKFHTGVSWQSTMWIDALWVFF